jgi:DNA-binding GntR family transcriptional regulator
MLLLRDRIYRAIRSAILTCEFRPGQELREQALAERFRVSRSPIRDTLLRLEQEQLVTVLPRRGYRVNPISMSDVEDIFSLRLLIQPACAGADDTALRTLDRFRVCAIDDQNETGFIDYNTAFHRAIEDLAGNARMAAIACDLDGQFARLVRISLRAFRHQQVRVACSEHEAIINSLQDHDADRASRLAYEHLAGGHSRIAMALRLAPWEGVPSPALVAAATASSNLMHSEAGAAGFKWI